MEQICIQLNLYLTVTLGEWLSDRLIEVDRLIQVVQNTDQNTVKCHFILQLMKWCTAYHKSTQKFSYSVESNYILLSSESCLQTYLS